MLVAAAVCAGRGEHAPGVGGPGEATGTRAGLGRARRAAPELGWRDGVVRDPLDPRRDPPRGAGRRRAGGDGDESDFGPPALGMARMAVVEVSVCGAGGGGGGRFRVARAAAPPLVAARRAPLVTCVRRGCNQGAGAGSRPFVGCGSQGLGDARRREAGADRCEHAPGVGGGGPCKSWVLMSAELPLSLIKCRRAGLLAGASHAMPPPGLVQAGLDVG